MKKELIQELFLQFEKACYNYNKVECWSARELQHILGYSKWENFSKVIDKAKNACLHSGIVVSDHFPDIRKMIDLGKGGQRAIDDVALTRYAYVTRHRMKKRAKKKNAAQRSLKPLDSALICIMRPIRICC